MFVKLKRYYKEKVVESDEEEVVLTMVGFFQERFLDQTFNN